MSLLREIQDAAIDSKGEIAPLLRRCQVLAYELDHNELKKWVQHELNGYPKDEPLPAYRRLTLALTGTFLGPFGSSLREVPIANAALPKKVADLVNDYPLRSPIAEYEALAASDKDLQLQLPGNVLAAIGHHTYQKGYGCVEARHIMPAARMKGLIDTVRNRVLSFALELGKLGLESLDRIEPGAVATQNIPHEAVSQIFHTQIVGDNLTVAIGDNAHAQTVTAIVPRDLESLATFLRTQHVDESDVSELTAALAADPIPDKKTALGSQVSGWMGKMAAKAASGVWKVSLDVGTKVLFAAVQKYYGLGE